MHPIPFESPRFELPRNVKPVVCGCVPAEKSRLEAGRPGDPYEGVFLADFGH